MPITYYGSHELTKDYFQQQLVHSPPPIIGFDIETISLKERLPIGFAIATSPNEAWYFRTYPEPDPEVELVLPVLQNPSIKKVIHNAPFDLRAFPLVGGIDTSNIADTNIMARLLGRRATKLVELAYEVNRSAESVADMLKPSQTMLDLNWEDVAGKCANDAQVALALYYHYLPDIDPEYFAIEMAAIPILIEMSLRGIKIDQEGRAEIEAKYTKDVEYYRGLCNAENFNPNSPQQVGYILAKRGNFLPMTKSKKQLKASVEELEFLDDPMASIVLSFRHANTFLTRYIIPLRGEDRIYTEYNLDAVVGRISSSNRNLQNIPPEARFIFMPDSDAFTTGDFSQEHLRIIAYMSQDRQMLRVFEEGEMGGDIHMFTAKEMNISRRVARNVNYAIPYGATPKALSFTTKIRDVRKCSNYLDRWFKTFPEAAEWIKGVQADGVREGWAAPTLFNRRIRIPDDEDLESQKRKAVNYPVLGSDGEVIKRALIVCKRKNLPLVVCVHDSITCDGDIEFPIDELENISAVHLPFEVKQTYRWE